MRGSTCKLFCVPSRPWPDPAIAAAHDWYVDCRRCPTGPLRVLDLDRLLSTQAKRNKLGQLFEKFNSRVLIYFVSSDMLTIDFLNPNIILITIYKSLPQYFY